MNIIKKKPKSRKVMALLLTMALVLGGIYTAPEVSAVTFDTKPPTNGIWDGDDTYNEYIEALAWERPVSVTENIVIELGTAMNTSFHTPALTNMHRKQESSGTSVATIGPHQYRYNLIPAYSEHTFSITADHIGETSYLFYNVHPYKKINVKVVDTHKFDFVSNGTTISTQYKTQHNAFFGVWVNEVTPSNYDSSKSEFLGWTWSGQTTPVKNISSYKFESDMTFTANYASIHAIDVVANPTEGGTPQANVNSSKAGETITVQLNPNDKYLVDSINSTVALTGVDWNRDTNMYTFTMPDASIKLTVNYKDKPFVNDNDLTPLQGLAYTGVYDGTSHDALTSAPNLGEGITYEYSLDGGKNYSKTIPQVQDVGETEVTIKASKYNHQDAVTTITAEVTKRPVELLIDNVSITYGDGEPTLTASVETGVPGEGMVGTDNLNYTLDRVPGTDAGTYDISASFDASAYPNYSITAPNGTFTINQAVLTINVDNQTITAGDGLPTLTWSASGFAFGDNIVNTGLNVSTTTPATGTLAGTFAITAAADPLANYSFIYNNGQLTVDSPPVVIPVPAGPVAATPAAPAVAIPDAATPLAAEPTVIEENEVPLESGGSWSLVDLILAVITVLMGVSLLVTYFTGRREDRGLAKLLGIVPMAGAILLFLLTQDMSQSMVMVDNWTITFAAATLVQGGIVFLSRKKVANDNDQAMI